MKYSSYKKFEWKAMTVGLFFICSIQIMIFGFTQLFDPLMGPDTLSNIIPLNVFFYSVMIVTSILHPFIMRSFSLKFALLAGLLSDLFAVSLWMINESVGGSQSLSFLSFFFAGIAIISVINCLITYLVVEFPKSLGFAMIGLFLFANIGMSIQITLFSIWKERSFYLTFCILFITFLLLAVGFVYTQFFNPVVPKHLVHLRRGSLIWKEFHYRMALFIFAMLFYGIVETVYGSWGGVYLRNFMNEKETNCAIIYFWVAMVVGQLALLAPIYYYSARKIFSLLLLYGIVVTFFLEQQTEAHRLIFGYIAAGFGCSIIFPTLLAFFEKEVMHTCAFSKIESPIAFIETGISLMVGAYITGVGIVTLWVSKLGTEPTLFTSIVFHKVILLLVGIGLISTYLNWGSRILKDERH
jgi:hypothetical protein